GRRRHSGRYQGICRIRLFRDGGDHSLTSQNTVAVYGAYHQSAEVPRPQIDPIISDFEIASVKTGMLPSRETIEVAETIEKNPIPHAVIDPVIRSTSG
ncbi:MAG: bifunctional hydroxymethylpyrimidine kinase/phosphomethylpyrimidine kinase, partial [Acidobacteria bacterium]|nr:bifunctional hydroxymethylpyrimidine kinase/phosphomethylpyrimidine kinase [Acidobacteriota bacterium]